MILNGDIRCASDDAQGLLEELQRRDKIIDALAYQVERSLNDQGRDYGLLQTTVVLEDQIRQRTEELTAALEALGEVSARATAARLQLETAVENISDGFALFDPEDRSCCATRPSASSTALPATPATAPWVTCWPKPPAATPPPADPAAHPAAGRGQDGRCEMQLPSGQALQIREHRMADGCLVGIYSDVTDLKAEEAPAPARAGPQVAPAAIHPRHHRPRHRRLRCDHRLVAWNLRYFELLACPSIWPRRAAHWMPCAPSARP
jgi:hypothetical protein